jgi:hypothetical protein
MNKKILIFAAILVFAAILAVAGVGVASAFHEADGMAQGAPAHSGGLDRNGCHNASVPYQCH